MDQQAETPLPKPPLGPRPQWEDSAALRVEYFASNLGQRAQGEASRITHPGEGADMNAALVHAIRQSTLQGVQIDLGYLAEDVRQLTEQKRQDRDREAEAAKREAYGQGVADGVAKGREYHAREVADNERQAQHGNPATIRDLCKVIVPKGKVAAWMHIDEEPDGGEFYREVYGRLTEDVREGDNRAQITAGPDRFMVGLDRVRFADTVDEIIAQRDVVLGEGLELTDSGGTVRLVDAMDKGGHLDVNITTLEEGENAEGSAPGTYVRLVSVRPGNGRVTLDLSPGQWYDLTQLVEKFYARRMVALAEGDES